MSRKKRKFEQNLPAADRYMEDMKLKDIKRECVVRGIDFEFVVTWSIPDLQNWFRANFYNKTNHARLDEFDDWQEKKITDILLAKGEKPEDYLHPSLRLGYIAETDSKGNVIKRKRAKVIIAKVKKKRERTKDGLFEGTKKSYTYALQAQGKSKTETLSAVLAKFPDASEKSVGIWYNKAKKLHNAKKG